MSDALKLLLLEDSSEDATLIQKLLQRSGLQFTSIVASDEKEFLHAVDNSGFDAVLADNALPQYSSIEALRIIKEKNPHVAFILVTGTVSEEFAVHIIQEGADDYILKTNLTRLPAALQKAIEKKRIERENEEAGVEMKKLNEELRLVSAHLEKVREEEQSRIAREVHDQLGQLLTGLKLNLIWIIDNFKKSSSQKLIAERLNEMLSITDDAMITVRKIAYDLRPAVLDDLGLIEALDWHGKQFSKQSGIKVYFKHPKKEPGFDPSISIGLFRIYQEALTNVARHANASNVTVSFEVSPDQILLSVQDDGNGFDTADKKKTLGLIGMKERAAIIGGQLEIESTPGQGTLISVIITR